MIHACRKRVMAKRFEDLEAWQLADELRREVYELTATGSASKDFKFCNQIRDAASSACRNISEGFGRFRPAPFAQFMEYSIASTMETQDALKDGVERGHWTIEKSSRARSLAARCLQVSRPLMLYLKRKASEGDS